MKRLILGLILLFSYQVHAREFIVGVPVQDTILTYVYGTGVTPWCTSDSLRIELPDYIYPYVTGLNFQVEITSISGTVISNVSDTVRVGDIYQLPIPSGSKTLRLFYPDSGCVSGFLIELVGTPLVAGESYACSLTTVRTLAWCFNWLSIIPFDDSICTVQPSASLTESIGELPEKYELKQNYPNPFNPFTSIQYDLPEQSQVTLMIYDILGIEIQTLVNTNQDAGYKSVIWDGTDEFGNSVGIGIYLYQIKAGNFSQTKKMLLLQ